MRRTLLAIGIAVLVSMMAAPHGNSKTGRVDVYLPFFMDGIPYYWSAYTDAYSGTYHPAGWITVPIDSVMVGKLMLQTVFLATLFAVAVNIRWRRSKRSERHTP